jgi:hypothetical protein
MVCNGRDLNCLIHNKGKLRTVVNTIINIRIPYNAEEFLLSCTTGPLSKRAQFPRANYNNDLRMAEISHPSSF